MNNEKAFMASGDQGRQFFLDRLQAQARAEGKPLSKIELRYLDYSRIESEEDADRVEEAFTREFDDDEFSNRIASLVRNALLQDRKRDPQAPARYKEFANVLKSSSQDSQLFAFWVRRWGLGLLKRRTCAKDFG